MPNPAAGLEPIPQELAYAAQLLAHVPEGKAWARGRDSNNWGLLRGLGAGLARVHVRAQDLARETDPRTSTELLPEWEAALGLPDECTGPLTDIAQRRAAVLARLIDQGSQTPADLEALAAGYGFEIEIVEHPVAFVGEASIGDSIWTNGDPAVCGVSTCGDSLGLWLGWSFVVDVEANVFTAHEAVCGSSCGIPLREWGNDLLECVMLRARPAHVLMRFVYSLPLQPGVATATLIAPSPTII